jgi:hypothetical protein
MFSRNLQHIFILVFKIVYIQHTFSISKVRWLKAGVFIVCI